MCFDNFSALSSGVDPNAAESYEPFNALSMQLRGAGLAVIRVPVLVDVPNMIDYMLIIFYGGNLDAPISNFLGNNSPNNWYGLRDRTSDAGYRFVSHDAEHTLLNVSANRLGPYPAGDVFNKSNPQWVFQKFGFGSAEFRLQVELLVAVGALLPRIRPRRIFAFTHRLGV